MLISVLIRSFMESSVPQMQAPTRFQALGLELKQTQPRGRGGHPTQRDGPGAGGAQAGPGPAWQGRNLVGAGKSVFLEGKTLGLSLSSKSQDNTVAQALIIVHFP